MREQFTVAYLLLNGWTEEISNGQPVMEGMYRFYVKDKYKIKTRRNMFPLEIKLFKNDVLIMSSYITTVGFWKLKTKKFNIK